MAAVQEQDTALTDTGEKNIEAARNYSEKHTAVPYYVIARCWHSASWFSDLQNYKNSKILTDDRAPQLLFSVTGKWIPDHPGRRLFTLYVSELQKIS